MKAIARSTLGWLVGLHPFPAAKDRYYFLKPFYDRLKKTQTSKCASCVFISIPIADGGNHSISIINKNFPFANVIVPAHIPQ